MADFNRLLFDLNSKVLYHLSNFYRGSQAATVVILATLFYLEPACWQYIIRQRFYLSYPKNI